MNNSTGYISGSFDSAEECAKMAGVWMERSFNQLNDLKSSIDSLNLNIEKSTHFASISDMLDSLSDISSVNTFGDGEVKTPSHIVNLSSDLQAIRIILEAIDKNFIVSFNQGDLGEYLASIVDENGNHIYAGNKFSIGGCGACASAVALSKILGKLISPLNTATYISLDADTINSSDPSELLLKSISNFPGKTGADNMEAVANAYGVGFDTCSRSDTDYINNVLLSGGAICLTTNGGGHWYSVADIREKTDSSGNVSYDSQGNVEYEYLVVDSAVGVAGQASHENQMEWKSHGMAFYDGLLNGDACSVVAFYDKDKCDVSIDASANNAKVATINYEEETVDYSSLISSVGGTSFDTQTFLDENRGRSYGGYDYDVGAYSISVESVYNDFESEIAIKTGVIPEVDVNKLNEELNK